MNNKILKYLPPIIINWKKQFSKYGWHGNYYSWKEATYKCSGYDNQEIIEKCKNALLEVKNGNALFERDSVLFYKPQHNFQLLASLFYAFARYKENLNIIDFGGALGSTYFQYKEIFGKLNINWNIIEQNKFVECGKTNFQNNNLKFYNSIDECINENNPNILLFSNSLQYLETPHKVLDKLLEYNFDYIIFDFLSITNNCNDIITIQNVPPKIYKASYPCWFFNEKSFIKKFDNNYNKIFDYICENITYKQNIFHKGYLFEKK